MFWTRLAAGRYADASGSIATAHVYAAEGQIDAFRTMAKNLSNVGRLTSFADA